MVNICWDEHKPLSQNVELLTEKLRNVLGHIVQRKVVYVSELLVFKSKKALETLTLPI